MNFAAKLGLIGTLLAGAAYAEPKIHLIMLIDSQAALRGANIAPQCEAMASVWESLFRGAFETDGLSPEQQRIQVHQFSGEAANPGSLKIFLEDSNFDAGSSLVFYYCGHGAVDRTQGPFFQLGRGGVDNQGNRLSNNLLRTDLRSWLLAKRTRTVLMLTDSCGIYANVQDAPKAPGPLYTAFEDLFVNTTGLVDMNAAAPGEYAWFTDGGGVFSGALSNVLVRGTEILDTNRDGRTTWREVFPQIQAQVAEDFKEGKTRAAGGSPMKSARTQTAHAWSLGN